jgi:hypothetical protein
VKALNHTGIGSNCMNRTLIAQQLRERIDKWDYMKLELCPAKQTVARLKRQPIHWAKNFAIYTPDKGLTTRIERGYTGYFFGNILASHS